MHLILDPTRLKVNFYLLTAINESEKRLRPAIAKRQKVKPYREFLMRYVRIFSTLREIPLRLTSGELYFLDAFPRENSKAFAIVEELTKAGVLRESIYAKSKQASIIKTSFRLVYYILVLLPVLFGLLKKRKTNLNLINIQVIIGYTAYKYFLRRNKNLVPIIISDITPQFHMLWAAAVSLNRKVFWWQDDYHHYKGFSKENYMPYPCTHAAVLNQNGLNTVLEKSPNAKIYSRKQTEVKTIKAITDNPKVGIATNAFFEANQKQIELLIKIKEKLKIDFLKIRLHPNSRLTSKSFPEGLLVIAPINESISDFANSVDLAIVGNSAVQLKLLCEGLPILHIAGLDNHGFDAYKYCQIGFCFGLKDFEEVNLDKVKSFYLNTSISEKLKDYVSLKNRGVSQPLSKLSSIIN